MADVCLGNCLVLTVNKEARQDGQVCTQGGQSGCTCTYIYYGGTYGNIEKRKQTSLILVQVFLKKVNFLIVVLHHLMTITVSLLNCWGGAYECCCAAVTGVVQQLLLWCSSNCCGAALTVVVQQ